MILISGAPFPVATASAVRPQIYAQIESSDENYGVLDLPTDAGSTMDTSRYLYWQSAHGKGIPYAPDARASTSSLLRYGAFRRLAAACSRRPDEHQRLGLNRWGQNSHHMQSLKAAGIGWIVLHHQIDPQTAPKLEAIIRSDLGEGLRVDDATLWKLP